ncbi:hypothetical protein H2198_001646 [Neophaeococcomyces mojaviensis]|uniref:Uncharacterized protein n=1 Tax=Neophaeococcomyces mojaviensis TaxID=3383035 RepID=A0ACC3AH34_9EURO|nr:hypothetical protein H2198_001646 [Knufia sp. JES_112]
MSTIQRHPDKLADRSVLLIAGTGGIGKAVASALLSRGAKVILTSTRQAKLDDTVSQLLQLYPEKSASHVTGYTLDLGSQSVEDNIKTLVTNLKKDGITKLDHLIYLAGDPLPTFALEDITLESWAKASQVRTISCILCIKHLIPFLRAAGPATAQCSPSITLTGGSVSDKPIPGGWTLLAMIAASLNGAARQLALDLKPIRVNTVAPGIVDTDLWSGMDEAARNKLFDDAAKTLPTGRVGDVQDVAESYLWCMCDGNVTGEVVRTNSGSLLV